MIRPERGIPLAILGLLLTACGGGEPTQAQAGPTLPAGTALPFLSAFLTLERGQASPSSLPSWVPAPDGESWHLVSPTLPACVSSAAQSLPDGTTTVTWTYACAGADGGLLTGSIAFTLAAPGTGTYALHYQGLKYVLGTRSWTWNGTKLMVLQAIPSQATLTTPVPLTLTVADTAGSGFSRTYSYGCTLTSDWAAAGSLKLWGSFTFQATGEPALEGRIAPGSPLTWTTASGCCHPAAGTLSLSQGPAWAEVVFGLPCGSVQWAPPSGPPLAHRVQACPS